MIYDLTIYNLRFVTLTEEMGEMFVVKGGETFAIVNGLTYDKHGGEGEVVVVDNLRKVFEDTAIDALVWPREMIAGSNRGILWIFHQEFTLHVIDD